MRKKLVQCLQNINVISEDNLFDETTYASNYIDNDILKKVGRKQVWYWKEMASFVYKFNDNAIPFKNLLSLIQYLLCVPGTNAPTERIFSLMNAIWTSEKTALKVEMFHAMLILKYNMGNCEAFYDILLCQNPELVKKCHSGQKYNFK